MENAPYVYKSPEEEEDKIKGWLQFFLVVASINIVFSLVFNIIGFDMNNFNWTGNQLTTYILASVDWFFILGTACFGAYMIYSGSITFCVGKSSQSSNFAA